MTSDTKTVTVELGEQQQTLDEQMATGRYASPDAVIQEALQALEREDAMIEEMVDEPIAEAMEEVDAQPTRAVAGDRNG